MCGDLKAHTYHYHNKKYWWSFLFVVKQTYLSMKTQQTEERRNKLKNWSKFKYYDVQTWMKRHGLKKKMRNDIQESITQRWEHMQDVDIKNLVSILPPKSKKSLKHFLCTDMLRKVSRSLSIYKPLETLSKFDFNEAFVFIFSLLRNYVSVCNRLVKSSRKTNLFWLRGKI